MSVVDHDPVTQFVQEWATYLGVDSTIPAIEPEPEQIYLLGSRYADYGLALGFALLLPIIRAILNYCVFVPLGERALTAASKRNDSIKCDPERMRKWKESAWKLTAFTTFTLLALAVSVGEKWFTDSRYFWLGCSHFPPCNLTVSPGVLLFYALETGFYIQSIHFLFFHEVRRKDWLESMIHHWVTTGLLAYSYYVNFTRIGVMVMLVHDCCDMWMEAAKLARYCGRNAQVGAPLQRCVLELGSAAQGACPCTVKRGPVVELLAFSPLGAPQGPAWNRPCRQVLRRPCTHQSLSVCAGAPSGMEAVKLARPRGGLDPQVSTFPTRGVGETGVPSAPCAHHGWVALLLSSRAAHRQGQPSNPETLTPLQVSLPTGARQMRAAVVAHRRLLRKHAGDVAVTDPTVSSQCITGAAARVKPQAAPTAGSNGSGRCDDTTIVPHALRFAPAAPSRVCALPSRPQANAWFVLFFLSWIVFRLIIFPFYIIRSTLFEPILLVVVPYKIEASPHYQIFNALLLVLLVLHIYWSWLIFKVLHRSLTQGEVADVREEDD
ncbi:MAG: hypothetical protein WDW38_000358 [Sanguina aurantia]